jgi:hypothetical protein
VVVVVMVGPGFWLGREYFLYLCLQLHEVQDLGGHDLLLDFRDSASFF